MTQLGIMLTPKNVYRLVTGNLPQVGNRSILDAPKAKNLTLIRFWWNALMGIVPGEALDPYFNVSDGRRRSLSDVMNRTRTPALPQHLKQALEQGLRPERFRCMVQWMYGMLNQTINLPKVFRSIDDMEDLCAAREDDFRRLMPFFEGLRMHGSSAYLTRTRGVYLAAIRLSWLGLHAMFGDDMDNTYLAALRNDPQCSESNLWELFMQINEVSHEEEELQPASAEVYLTLGETVPAFDEAPVCDELNRARVAAAAVSQQGYTQYAGWYVVANWTDPCVALNDTARATYRGAVLMDQVMNGTPVYVFMASGYEGLNKSSGCWGYTYYHGKFGYVPMTYLIRLK